MTQIGSASSAFICGLSNYHDHLALASAIKLAKKNSLPAPEQQLSIIERNRDEEPVRLALMCASEFSSP